ncbi:MAG TPA: hypothetical protein VIL69_00675, partial [Roseomonas sp.]
DYQLLRAESDHNQRAIHQQAARLRARREAETARAFFWATRYANGTKRHPDGTPMKDAQGRELGYTSADLAEVYPVLMEG